VSVALRNAKGCLTEAGFRALERSAVGQAPAELAAHMASCATCQERMLSGRRAPSETPRAERKPPPPAWRIWALLGFTLLLIAMFAATVRWLAAR